MSTSTAAVKSLWVHPALLSVCVVSGSHKTLINAGQQELVAGREWFDYSDREVEMSPVLPEEG